RFLQRRILLPRKPFPRFHENFCSKFLRQFHGRVGTARIHHNNFIGNIFYALQRAGNVRFLVERDDADRKTHARKHSRWPNRRSSRVSLSSGWFATKLAQALLQRVPLWRPTHKATHSPSPATLSSWPRKAATLKNASAPWTPSPALTGVRCTSMCGCAGSWSAKTLRTLPRIFSAACWKKI